MNNCDKNCETCVHCWTDESVGDRECTNTDEMTEEEIEKYYSEMENGCPYYRSQEDNDQAFMQALVDTDFFNLYS